MALVHRLLADRAKTHGRFEEVALCSQRTKELWRQQPNWSKLTDCQREALEAIASKVARILCGNPSYPDHFRDIAGYAELVVNRLNERGR